MSASCQSLGIRREALRPRYEDQGSAKYRVLGEQGNFSKLRTSDVNIAPYERSAHHERKHRPSQMVDYPSWRSQREGSSLRSGSTTHRSGSSFELVSTETRRSGGRKAKAYEENTRVQKSWVETPRHLLSSRPESPKSSSLPKSQREFEKMVRFSDDVYRDATLPGRLLGAVGHQEDSPKGQSAGKLVRAPGNGKVTGEFQDRGGYRKALPKRSRASERQQSYVPAAPIIPRLPTPDLDSTSDYELGLAKYDFCRCCSSDDRDEDECGHWRNGKAKMDKQVDHARAYISRVTMSERLITEA